ncbi:MAG: hypothetical protein AB7T49_14950 [Oligoflexales bacterium]
MKSHFCKLLFLTIVIAACRSTSMTPISQRPLGTKKVEGEGGEMYVSKRKIEDMQAPETLYRKSSEQVIVPVDKSRTSGSLYNLDDMNNNLFLAKERPGVHDFITVNVEPNRGSKPDTPEATAAAGEKKPDAAAKDELLSALPSLGADSSDPKLINELNMRIERVMENGDLLVSFERSSVNKFETNLIQIHAKIPYEATLKEEPISTKDLFDVKWVEQGPAETIDRSSFNWEDEYTLRLSGFSEANSKIASKIKDDQKQLMKVRNDLHNKITSFSEERKTVAEERKKLLEDRAAMDSETKDLNDKIEDLTKTVEEQKELIDEMDKAQGIEKTEKPGDKKDAAKGK